MLSEAEKKGEGMPLYIAESGSPGSEMLDSRGLPMNRWVEKHKQQWISPVVWVMQLKNEEKGALKQVQISWCGLSAS